MIGRCIPEVDEVMEYDAPWMKATHALPDGAREMPMIELLHESLFDGAVIFTTYTQSPLPAALMCWEAGIPLRLAHCHENPYQLLTHWVPDPEPSMTIRHEVRRQLDLVSMIGALTPNERLSLGVNDESRQRVISHLEAIGFDLSSRWILVHPGATAPSRRYPADSYAEVAKTLTVDEGLHVLFTGSAAERDLIGYIRGKMNAPSWSVAGDLTLKELCGIVSMSPLLIANNTGPVHIPGGCGHPGG